MLSTFLAAEVAIELARERVLEAAEQRLAVEARRPAYHDDRRHPPVGPLRRVLARGAVLVSRGATQVARTLDARTADEIAEQLQRSHVS